MTLEDREPDLEAALADALRVEPSPQFLARVRERLRGEAPGPRLGWVLAALLAGATLALVLLLASPRRDEEPVAWQARVVVPPLPTPEASPAAVVPQRPRPARHVATYASPAPPEVLVPESQRAALARFVSGLEGREPPDIPLSVPFADLAVTDVHIEPLSIEPLSGS